MTTTVYGFVKGKLLVTTVTKDDYLTGMIRTRVSITKDLPSKTKTDLAREWALRHRRQGRLAELEEVVRGGNGRCSTSNRLFLSSWRFKL